MSVDLILEKETENTTDTGESLLMMGMSKQVTSDDHHKPKDLASSTSGFIEVLPQWFNSKCISRELKRLGFKEKRHRGHSFEYRLTPESVKDMADRLGVALLPDEEAVIKAEEEDKKKAEAEAEAKKKAE